MASVADSSRIPAPSLPPGSASAALRAARRSRSAARDQGGDPARGGGSLGAERPLSEPLEGSSAPSGGRPLGINTGIAATVAPQALQLPASPDETRQKIREVRRERYRLLDVVRKVFPKERTAACMHCMVPDSAVTLHRHRETGKAFYSGLMTCGSVWLCSVCSSKISERRRTELSLAIERAQEKGWKVYLLTLTVPHGLGDDLKPMLDKLKKAWRRMGKNRDGEKVKDAIGFEGSVRAFEVTNGKNGFHPHFHALLFLDTDLTPEQVKALYSPLWRRHCVAVGLPEPSDAHGCRVDGGEKAAQYVSKWGLPEEMTKSHLKKAKKGDSMWDLLRKWADNRDASALVRFKLFYEAFKGERQLVWSKKVRELLRLGEELTDEQLAQEQTEAASVVAQLEPEDWCMLRKVGMKLDLLELAETRPERVPDFLHRLRAMTREVGLDFEPSG